MMISFELHFLVCLDLLFFLSDSPSLPGTPVAATRQCLPSLWVRASLVAASAPVRSPCRRRQAFLTSPSPSLRSGPGLIPTGHRPPSHTTRTPFTLVSSAKAPSHRHDGTRRWRAGRSGRGCCHTSALCLVTIGWRSSYGRRTRGIHTLVLRYTSGGHCVCVCVYACICMCVCVCVCVCVYGTGGIRGTRR